jgi:hypothetical protein
MAILFIFLPRNFGTVIIIKDNRTLFNGKNEATAFIILTAVLLKPWLSIIVPLPLLTFLPLQGGGQEGDGSALAPNLPIPTPTLPLKGREFFQRKISANHVIVCELR